MQDNHGFAEQFLDDIPRIGGIVSQLFPVLEDESRGIFAYAASLGDLGEVLPNVARAEMGGVDRLIGLGIADSRTLAKKKAFVEALERYCSSVVPESLLFATAEELKSEALSLELLPRCSQQEEDAADGALPITGWSTTTPMHWIRGVRLADQQAIWIPAILAFNRYPYARSEPFWIPTSAGCAAHFSLTRAVYNGLLEVIERDCLALSWLLNIACPQLSSVKVPSSLLSRITLLDASLDHPVKCVFAYSVNSQRNDLRQVLTAAVASSSDAAASKAIRDAETWHQMVKRQVPKTMEMKNISQPSEAAQWMAHESRAELFDFLFGDDLNPGHSIGGKGCSDDLKWLVSDYQSRGHHIYAVNLSTSEASHYGISVVRVLVPTLMPLSYRPHVRYLAHPRLAEIAALYGKEAPRLDTVNPWPIPFG